MKEDFAFVVLEETMLFQYIVTTETDGCGLFTIKTANLRYGQT